MAVAPRSADSVSSTPFTVPPCGVSTTSSEDFELGWFALGRLAKERVSFGVAGGVVVSDGSGVGVLE
ncbi:hypothetical protein QWU11_46095 [Actinomadura sp. DC4]|nr:hypothetical protein [Actinomadura sp. DC4]